MTCVGAGNAAKNEGNKNEDKKQQRKRLKEFERGGVQKYLKEKLYEGEKGETDKKADTMLHE